MAVYEVQGPDGSIYEVEAPDGASENAIINFLSTELKKGSEFPTLTKSELQQPEIVEPNPDPDGVFSFAADQAQSVTGKGLEAVGRLTGFESLEDYGTNLYEQQKEDIALGGYKSDYGKSFADTFDEDGVGAAIGWIGEKIAENSITTGASLVGAGATAVAALFSAPVAAVFGVGTLLGSALLGTGEVAEEIERKTGDYDPKLAVGVGAFIGFLDKFGATKVIPKDQLAKLSVKEVMKQLTISGFGDAAKAVARRTLIKGGYEGLTETGQELSSVGAAAYSGGEYTGKEVRDRLIDAFAVGTGMGGGVSLGVDTTSGIASLFNKGTTETTPTEQTTTSPIDSTDDAIQTSLFPVNEQDKIVKDLSKELGISEAEVARELSNLKNITKEDTVKSPAELRQEALLDPQNLRIEEPTIDTQQGTTDPNQLDIVDQLETKQLEEMIAEDTKVQDREAQRQQAVTDPSVRVESEFETARGTLEASQQKTSADKRNTILQNVVTEASRNPDKKNINKLRRDFAKALSSEGIVNTTPTETELNTLRRATDVLTAVESQYEMPTQMEMFPGATKVPTTVIDENFDTSQKLSDFVAMEAAPERREGLTATTSQDVVQQEADPNQLDLDLVARQKETPTVEPAVEPVEGKAPTNPVLERAYQKMSVGEKKLGKLTDEEILELTKVDPYKRTEEQKVGIKKLQDEIALASAARTESPTPEKKSTRVTKPKSTRSDAVEKIGKTLGKGPRIKRAKKETRSKEEILKDKIKKEEPQKIDKGTVTKALEDVSKQQEQSLKSAETQRKKREAAKKEGKKTLDDVADSVIKVNKLTKKTTKKGAFTLKEKAEQKIAVDRDEFSNFQALDKFTGTEEDVSKSRKEADELKNYTEPFKGEDIDIKFTDAEILKIYNLVNNPPKDYLLKEPKRDPTGRAAAYIYFSKHEAPKDVLPVLAYDLVFADKTYTSTTGESRASRLYFYKTGRENAELTIKWLETNFGISKVDIKTKKGEVDSVKQSKSLNFLKQLVERETYELTLVNAKESLTDTIEKPSIDNYIVSGVVKKAKLPTKTIVKEGKIVESGLPATIEDIADTQNITVEEAKAKYEAVPTVRDERLRKISYYWMETTALSELDKPVHPVVRSLIEQGNLKEALIALGANIQNSRLSKIALDYSKLVGNTKIKFADFVVNEEGKTVSGSFDPKTNTITLDRDTGFNSHTILHEMTHALTAAELANPNSVSTKQLNTIFEAVKDNLGTVYGARNLDEFVAEARSNPAFRQRLAQMNPKTGGSNYLERFNNVLLNIIRRLLSMQTKTVDTALNATDRLVEGILSPSPESRNADKLFMDDKNIVKAIGAKIKTIPKAGYDALDRALSGMSIKTLKETGKKLRFGFIPLFNFVNFKSVQKYVPMAPKLFAISNKRAGRIQAIVQKIEKTLAPMSKWAKKNVVNGNYDTFSSTVLASTLAQVKPYLPLAEAKKQYTNPEKLDNYLRLRDEYIKLDPEGQKHFKTMFTMFRGIYDDLKSAIMTKLNTINLSDEAKTKISNNVFERMFKSGAIDPYAPLPRSGNFWLIYNATDPVTGNFERFIEAFEDGATRKKVMKDINAYTEIEFADDIAKAVAGGMSKEEAIQTMNDMQESEPANAKNYKNAPSGSFVNDVLDILQQNQVSPEVEQTIMNLFIDLLPETSFAKGFLKRKGIRGFDGDIVPRVKESRAKADMIKAYKEKARSVATQIAKMEAAVEIVNFDRSVDEHIKKTRPNDPKAIFYQQQLLKYSKFIAQDTVKGFARVGTAFGFFMTLGLNVSSAVMNPFQLVFNSYTFLSGKHGHKKAFNAIALGAKLFMKSPKVKISEVYGADAVNDVAITDEGFAGSSIDNYDFDDPALPNIIKEFDVLAQLAGEHGQLQRSIAQEQLDLDFFADDRRAKAQAIAGYLFHHSERFTRQVTLMSSYHIELQRLKELNGLSEKGKKIEDVVIPKQLEKSLKLQAFNEAIYFNELSNGGALATGAPTMAQGSDVGTGLVKIAFLFKRFGVTQAIYLATLTGRSFKRNNTKNKKELAKKLDITNEQAEVKLLENRKIARTQLAYTYIAFGTVAGVMGMPLLSTLAEIFDLLLTDEDEDDFKTILRDQLHALPRDGIVNYFTGFDFSSRIGLSDFVFRDSLIDDPNLGFGSEVLNFFGGPVVGVLNNWYRGLKLIQDGQIEKGILSFMPAFVKNNYKGLIKYPREGIRNKNYDLLYDTSAWDNLGQFFGFAPSKYVRGMEQSNAKKSKEIAILARKNKLMSKYYIAYKQGDDALQDEVFKGIEKFNSDHPELYITLKDIAKSMKIRLETSQQVEMDGVSLNKKLREGLNEDLNGWDQPLTFFGDLENILIKPK